MARLQSAGKRLGKYHAKPPCKQRTVEGVPLKSMCCRAGTGSSVLDPSPSVCGLSFVACSGPQMLHAPALWEQKEHLTSWRRRATHTHTKGHREAGAVKSCLAISQVSRAWRPNRCTQTSSYLYIYLLYFTIIKHSISNSIYLLGCKRLVQISR